MVWFIVQFVEYQRAQDDEFPKNKIWIFTQIILCLFSHRRQYNIFHTPTSPNCVKFIIIYVIYGVPVIRVVIFCLCSDNNQVESWKRKIIYVLEIKYIVHLFINWYWLFVRRWNKCDHRIFYSFKLKYSSWRMWCVYYSLNLEILQLWMNEAHCIIYVALSHQHNCWYRTNIHDVHSLMWQIKMNKYISLDPSFLGSINTFICFHIFQRKISSFQIIGESKIVIIFLVTHAFILLTYEICFFLNVPFIEYKAFVRSKFRILLRFGVEWKNHKYNKSPRCYPILFNDIGRNTTETIAAINSISTIRVWAIDHGVNVIIPQYPVQNSV